MATGGEKRRPPMGPRNGQSPPSIDLGFSCYELIQPFAELSHLPLDFSQLRIVLPPTQIVVAALLGDVCLELASQHADVRVTVDRPFAIFEPSSVDARDDEI